MKLGKFKTSTQYCILTFAILSSGCHSTPTLKQGFEENAKPDCQSCYDAACEYERGEKEPVCENPALEDYINRFVQGCEKLKAAGSCPIFEQACPDSGSGGTINGIDFKDLDLDIDTLSKCPVPPSNVTISAGTKLYLEQQAQTTRLSE